MRTRSGFTSKLSSQSIGSHGGSSRLMFERGSLSTGKKRVRIDLPIEMNQPSYDSGPSCLMTGAQSSSVVTVEIFVKQNVVAPVRVVLELLRASVDWAAP